MQPARDAIREQSPADGPTAGLKALPAQLKLAIEC